MKRTPLEVNIPLDVEVFMKLYRCAQRGKHRQTVRQILARAIDDYAESLDRATSDAVAQEPLEREPLPGIDADGMLRSVGAALAAIDAHWPEVRATGIPIGAALEQALGHWLDAVNRLSAVGVQVREEDVPPLRSVLRDYSDEEQGGDDDEESLQSTPATRRPKQAIRVRFPNDLVIAERYAADTFCGVVREIGCERVASLNLMVSGHPLVAREQHPNYKSQPMEGWFVTPPSSNSQKIDVLKKVDRSLNVGLTIEAIDPPNNVEPEGDDDESDNPESNKKSWPTTIQVVLPDSRLISERKAFDTLRNVIEHFGVEKVAQLNIGSTAYPLLTRAAHDRYNEIGGGWFLYANTSTETKHKHIQQIGERLGVDLLAEIVERPRQ